MAKHPSKESQKELFDFESARKDREEKGFSLFTGRRTSQISLSVQQLFVCFVVFVILLGSAYTAGFWRGKSIKISESRRAAALEEEILLNSLMASRDAAAKAQTAAPAPSAAPQTRRAAPSSAPVPAAAPQTPAAPPKTVAKDSKKPYTIQLVAYRSEEQAFKEIAKLQARGYRPRIITKSGYYQICVGQYQNLTEAERDIRALKKNYKDCFLRKV